MMRATRSNRLAVVFVTALATSQLAYADTLADRIRVCVGEHVGPTTSVAESRARVDCPAADLVNFSERRHNLNGAIKYVAPTGSVIVSAPDAVSVEVMSNNDGVRGDIQISEDRTTATVPISCQGQGLGQGRAWFEGVLKVRVVKQSDVLGATLECARQIRAISR